MPLKKTLADLANDARRHVDEIEDDELAAQLVGPAPARPIVIDVRETDERGRGHIPDSLHIPRGILEREIEKRAFRGRVSDADLARPIVCYCGGGSRSLLAARTLQEMGFTDVTSLRGGFGAWGEAGRSVEMETSG